MKKAVMTPAFVLYFACSLVALTICLIGCHKNGSPAIPSIAGEWRLAAQYASTGIGGGGWEVTDGLNSDTLILRKDGSMSMSPGNIYTATSYRVTSDSTLVFNQGPGTLPQTTRYLFSGDTLIMYPPCIEPCGEKYVAVQQ